MVKKRLIAGILSAAVSIMQLVPSFAILAYADVHTSFSVSAGSAEGKPGETVSIDLTLDNSPGLNGLMVKVGYDSDAMECVGITENNKFGPDSFNQGLLTNDPIRLGWTSPDRVRSNGVLATLEFKIKDTAYNGDYNITLSTSETDNFKVDFLPVEGSDESEQKFTFYTPTLVNGRITVTDSTSKKDYTGKTPEAPVISDISSTSFDVSVPGGNEYTYSTAKITDFSGCKWYTGNTVTGLKGNTTYYVYTRVAETKTTKASKASAAAEVKTLKYDIYEVIESISIGTEGAAGTVLTPVIKYKSGFSAEDAGKITYLWSAKDWADEKISTAASYTITSDDADKARVLYVTVSANNCGDIIVSNPVTSGKSEFTGKVYYPAIKEKTKGGFTISAMPGYEYAISHRTALPANAKWSGLENDAVITEKPADSVWYVYVRAKAAGNANASEPIYTSVRIPNDDSSLSEIILSEGTLSPEFTSGVTKYKAIVPYGDKIPTVTVKLTDRNANVSIRQAESLADGKNTAVVTVKAENGIDTTTYEITFVEQQLPVLSALKINGESVNGFSKEDRYYSYVLSYIEWINNPSKKYTIEATPLQETASVKISENNFAVESVNPDISAYKNVFVAVSCENGDTVVYTITFEIEPCPHSDIKTTVNSEPTCTKPGEQESVCLICGKSWGLEYVPAAGHDWDEDWIYDAMPTCTEAGYISRHCKVPGCDAQNDIILIIANGHSWSEWEYADGNNYERSCSVCGEKESYPVVDISHEHKFDGNTEEITPASCNEYGSQKVYCSEYGCYEFVIESISKTIHTEDEEKWVISDPGCTTSGSGSLVCEICGEVTYTVEVPPTGHSFTIYTDTASCTSVGTLKSLCDNGCGTVCSAPSYPKGHSYGEWLSNAEGHWLECSDCDDITDIIPHTKGSGVVTVPATSTTTGVRTYYCSDCNYEMSKEIIPATGTSGGGTGTSGGTGTGGTGTGGTGTGTGGTGTGSGSGTGSSGTGSGTGSGSGTGLVPDSGTNISVSSVSPGEPYIINEPDIFGWDFIQYRLEDAVDGETVTVDMNGSYELPKSVLRAIQGRNIDLVLKVSGGISWTISGLYVTEPKNVNMRVSTSNKIPDDVLNTIKSEKKVVQLRLYHSGDFGFTAKLSLNVPVKYNDYFAALYRYDTKTSQLDYGDTYSLVSKNTAEFILSHASYYAVAFTSEVMFEDISSGAAAADYNFAMDTGAPVTNGIQIPDYNLPNGLKLSNRKRRYRIVSRRKLDDLVFVY